MGVNLNADTDWLSRATGLGSTGIIDYTIWGWHRRTSGLGYSGVSGGAIFGNPGNAGRHNSLRFDNTFGSGTEADPLLTIGDNGGETDFAGGDAHPAFDTWAFYILRVAGPAGAPEMRAHWTEDDGDTWHDGARTGTTENSIVPAEVLFGRGNTGDANTSQGDYAYCGARAEYMSEGDAKDLIFRSATDTGDWGYWRLANAADLADTSGNSRDLTANGSVVDASDPTIPSAGGGGSPRMLLLGVG